MSQSNCCNPDTSFLLGSLNYWMQKSLRCCFSVALPNGLQLHIPCEVKRAHAQDLWSAPVDQLAKRYMREPEVRYGFYLVGWYGIRTPPDPTHRKKYADLITFNLRFRYILMMLLVSKTRRSSLLFMT